MSMKPSHKRGDRVILMPGGFVAEALQQYMDCRDGTVLEYAFIDCSGYGSNHRAFFCTDSKSDSSSLIIYQYNTINGGWILLYNMCFDDDSWGVIKGLLNGECTSFVRDYSHENKP